jgi:hypothetical protein
LPTAEGVKVTLMLQFVPAAKLAPQVLVVPKSVGLTPVTATLLINNGALPVLLSVTICAALGPPSG